MDPTLLRRAIHDEQASMLKQNLALLNVSSGDVL
jgi:hypothetical protein